MVLTVMAVMAAMLVVMAAPAFASKTFPREFGSCGQKGFSLEENFSEIPQFQGVDFITFPNSGKAQGFQLHECPDNSPVG
jgi:hypothetical protein